jgi:hypothetical protein
MLSVDDFSFGSDFWDTNLIASSTTVALVNRSSFIEKHSLANEQLLSPILPPKEVMQVVIILLMRDQHG